MFQHQQRFDQTGNARRGFQVAKVRLHGPDQQRRFWRTVFTKRLGERVGFVIGWYCWANTFVSWAANATLFVDLVGGRFAWYHPFPHGKILAVALVVGLGAVNYYGIKSGAWVVNLLVIGKLGAIFFFLAAACKPREGHVTMDSWLSKRVERRRKVFWIVTVSRALWDTLSCQRHFLG